MRLEAIHDFKAKLDKGFVFGPFAKTSDPAFIEIIGHGKFDFVVLDLEHAPTSVQHLQELVRAAEVSGTFPIVRVKENVPSVIGEVLDIGAGGVQVPKITDAETARQVVQTAKFYPKGTRGVCRFVRAAQYSALDRFAYFQQANETVIILQLEGKEAIEHLDQILAVQDFDIIFIGPYDLSQSLGVPGQVNHPTVTRKMEDIVARCLRRGITVGTFTDTVEDARRWRSLGVKYLCYSVDTGMFYEKCREDVEKMRAK